MSNSRVLIIEDDELVRQVLVKQLRGLGREDIDEAGDAESARAALQGPVQYELILADLMLPGGDAVDLLRSTAGRQGRAGLILISALGEGLLRSVAVLCRERGQRVLGALRKPIRLEALSQLLGHSPPRAGSAAPPSRMATASDLRRVLETRGIGARVQPTVSASDGSLHAVEVLAHWVDPALGQVSAPRLSRLADDHGLGSALTQYMIGLALRTCADWRDSGLQVPVSINVGKRVLHDLQIPQFVERVLKSLQLQPESLSLEIGEHELLDDTDTLDVLSRMRMRGIGITLDNFGKGPASALRLQRLPISELKIDRAFVRTLPDGLIGRAVVDYAVRLAQGLGIATTAVGVETEEQAHAVKAMGCDRLQGYWLGEPMAPDELPGWLRNRSPGVESLHAAAAGQAAAQRGAVTA